MVRAHASPSSRDRGPRRGPRRLRALAWMAGLLVFAALPLSVRAQPITGNDFEVDAVDGPVLGSSREVGMAGAYTALASGASGAPFNPAAFAAREIYEYEPWAWDLTLSYFFPGVGGANDFFDNGRRGVDTSGFQFADIGGRLQYRNAGAGLLVRTLNYRVPLGTGTRFNVSLITAHVAAAYGLLDGQLTVGLGARVASMDVAVVRLGSNDSLVSFTGTGAEVGAILGLANMPFRVGLSARMPVDSRVAPDAVGAGTTQVAGLFLPRSVHLPWEIEAGFAWQLGPKPLNSRYLRYKRAEPRVLRALAGQAGAEDAAERAQSEVEREARVRSRSLRRRYLLLSGSLLLIGRTRNGVGLDAFLEQERRPRGRRISFGVRLGAEAEVVPDWLKLRAGFYVEPARQLDVSPRPHVTAGMDLRLFSVFGYTLRGTVTIDGAPRYADFGLGLGIWH
ncbi:MAG: hypothetical protein GXP55_20175 [Deltaproteobacteria bacterium]|nr:hypothetical protein [Deltaproteobacteria bacterium]